MRRLARAALVVLAAAPAPGILAACATPGPARVELPRAGADGDDGTGVLARLSRGQMPRVRVAPGDVGHVGDPYGGDPYGFDGGDVYGGGAYPAYVPIPPPTAGGYAVTSVVETGTGGVVEGVVVWKGARAPAQLPAVAAATACPGAFETRAPRVAASGALGGAVVYLADVRAGRAAPPAGVATLEIDGCRLAPVAQVITPIGTLLTVANHGDAATKVMLTRGASAGGPGAAGAAAYEVSLGARAEGQILLERDGILEVAIAGGHPAARAWIVVAPHPYHVTTDAAGRFRLDDIPPGEYTLVVWHPPVVTGLDAAGNAVRSDARETRVKIKVTPREVTTTRVELR